MSILLHVNNKSLTLSNGSLLQSVLIFAGTICFCPLAILGTVALASGLNLLKLTVGLGGDSVRAMIKHKSGEHLTIFSARKITVRKHRVDKKCKITLILFV